MSSTKLSLISLFIYSQICIHTGINIDTHRSSYKGGKRCTYSLLTHNFLSECTLYHFEHNLLVKFILEIVEKTVLDLKKYLPLNMNFYTVNEFLVSNNFLLNFMLKNTHQEMYLSLN